MTHSIHATEPATTPSDLSVIGWDIGGANTKAVRLDRRHGGPTRICAVSAPLAMERDWTSLVPTLRQLAAACGPRAAVHAVTMTAELSQAFRTKREGVAFLLDAMEDGFPGDIIRVYTVKGEFLDPVEAKLRPLEVAAANWAATARFVGSDMPDCLLVDVGSTTTDIIPITGGEPATVGLTDPERLLSGELVYTGAVRTPVESVAATVPLWGQLCPLAPERFAWMGDVYLWLGGLDARDYGSSPPDGRPATREFAGERLARAVCADAEMLDEEAVGAIARALAEAQVERVTAGIRRVHARHPRLSLAVVTGLGEFIAAEAARRTNLDLLPLAERLGDAARTAPATAVASLLADAIAPA